MNPQENSTFKFKVWSLLPEDVRKILPLVFLVVSVIFFIGLHSDCWFSVNCHAAPHSGAQVSAVIVGFATTLVVGSVLGAPITVATGVGVLCWLALRFWI
jgi:hypothetical protein